VAINAVRPWGVNNPVWRPYASGPLSRLLPGANAVSGQHVIAMIADDPAENDGDPLRDGEGEGNPGSGILLVRGEAFSVGGGHQVVEATVARTSPGAIGPGVRILSWRLLR
jgi:hypothetical protein